MFGKLLRILIDLWVRLTGKKLSLRENPWLAGPVGEKKVIGEHFYQEYAKKMGLKIEQNANLGLLKDFSVVIDPNDPQKEKLNPRITHFYETTSDYSLEVWAQWFSFIRHFARILITAVSKQINQLNIPLNPLETSHGMGSEVIRMEGQKGEMPLTCWLRKSWKTNQVVYAGFYSSCHIPEKKRNFVRVVFPLPEGSVTVILRVEVQEDGSVKLISRGNGIGDAGYYRVRKIDEDFVRVKYIPLKEIIHVFEDKKGVLRTDHQFFFWNILFLHLHYKMTPKQP